MNHRVPLVTAAALLISSPAFPTETPAPKPVPGPDLSTDGDIDPIRLAVLEAKLRALEEKHAAMHPIAPPLPEMEIPYDVDLDHVVFPVDPSTLNLDKVARNIQEETRYIAESRVYRKDMAKVPIDKWTDRDRKDFAENEQWEQTARKALKEDLTLLLL